MATYSTPPTTRESSTDSALLSTQVVSAVADAADCSRNDLPPLFEAIDPDALNDLFASPPRGERHTNGSVIFEYAGYEIDVHSSDGVTVRPIEELSG